MKPELKKALNKISPIKKLKKVKTTFLKFIEKHSERIEVIKLFIIFVLGYGLIINYSLNQIFHLPLTFKTIIAYGILYHFIKEEFVEWIRRIIVKGMTHG